VVGLQVLRPRRATRRKSGGNCSRPILKPASLTSREGQWPAEPA